MAEGIKRYAPDGITLLQWWDDDTSTYYEFDREGIPVEGTPRPYDDQEQAWAAWRAQDRNRATVRRQLLANVTQDLANMQTIIETPNADLNNTPAPALKALARAMRRINRIVIEAFDAAPE